MNHALTAAVCSVVGLALWLSAATTITEARAVALLHGVGIGVCLAVGYRSAWENRRRNHE